MCICNRLDSTLTNGSVIRRHVRVAGPLGRRHVWRVGDSAAGRRHSRGHPDLSPETQAASGRRRPRLDYLWSGSLRKRGRIRQGIRELSDPEPGPDTGLCQFIGSGRDSIDPLESDSADRLSPKTDEWSARACSARLQRRRADAYVPAIGFYGGSKEAGSTTRF